MGPFETHLREAIALNRARGPLYAEASAGASWRITRGLIASELLLLPLARWIDGRAEPYHRAGIPLLHDIFEPMERVAPFGVAEPVEPAPGVRPSRAHLRRIRTEALRGLRREGFGAAERTIQDELDRLAETHGSECMLRHLLESGRRICAVADRHAEQARGRGMASPLWIHRSLLRWHLAGLQLARTLDDWARPLQARGIPILQRDVPPIPRLPAPPAGADPEPET